MDSYWSVIKRNVVCFQKGRFNLEKINKIYFCCRRLENNQNFRRIELFSKLHLYFQMHEFIEGFTSSLVVNIQISSLRLTRTLWSWTKFSWNTRHLNILRKRLVFSERERCFFSKPKFNVLLKYDILVQTFNCDKLCWLNEQLQFDWRCHPLI